MWTPRKTGLKCDADDSFERIEQNICRLRCQISQENIFTKHHRMSCATFQENTKFTWQSLNSFISEPAPAHDRLRGVTVVLTN